MLSHKNEACADQKCQNPAYAYCGQRTNFFRKKTDKKTPQTTSAEENKKEDAQSPAANIIWHDVLDNRHYERELDHKRKTRDKNKRKSNKYCFCKK